MLFVLLKTSSEMVYIEVTTSIDIKDNFKEKIKYLITVHVSKVRFQ